MARTEVPLLTPIRPVYPTGLADRQITRLAITDWRIAQIIGHVPAAADFDVTPAYEHAYTTQTGDVVLLQREQVAANLGAKHVGIRDRADSPGLHAIPLSLYRLAILFFDIRPLVKKFGFEFRRDFDHRAAHSRSVGAEMGAMLTERPDLLQMPEF